MDLDVDAQAIVLAVAEADREVQKPENDSNRAESIRQMIKKLIPAEKLKAG